MIENNAIFIRSNAVVGDDDVQITDDGETDSVFNGVPDWVYEEEILGTEKCILSEPIFLSTLIRLG